MYVLDVIFLLLYTIISIGFLIVIDINDYKISDLSLIGKFIYFFLIIFGAQLLVSIWK